MTLRVVLSNDKKIVYPAQRGLAPPNGVIGGYPSDNKKAIFRWFSFWLAVNQTALDFLFIYGCKP